MSLLLQQSAIDAIRANLNLALKMFGQDVALFVPVNDNPGVGSMHDADPTRRTWHQVDTRAWIEMKPSISKLKKMGIFAEGEAPMICWIMNSFDVKIHSYIRIISQFEPRVYSSSEFEVVDVLIRAMQDKEALQCFKIAPRRFPGA